jgi:hypothetical protein
MAAQNHTIRQHYLHVELHGTEPDGLALQRRLPDWCLTQLLPVLDRVLANYAPLEGHLTIERLDIEVGSVSLERLEADLPGLVGQAIEKSLREQIPLRSSLTTPVNSNSQYKTVQQNLEEVLVYFLATGSLPWSFKLTQGKNLEQSLLNGWQENSFGNVNAILTALASASARKRLVLQFSEEFLLYLLGRIAPEIKKNIALILQQLRDANTPATVLKLFVGQLWGTVITRLVDGLPCTEIDLIRSSWQHLPVSVAEAKLLGAVLESYWPGAIASESLPENLAMHIRRDTRQGLIVRPSTSSGRTVKPLQGSLEQSRRADHERLSLKIPKLKLAARLTKQDSTAIGAKAQLYPGNTKVNKALTFQEEQLTAHPDIEAGIYIDNAGLVILHPFLPQFFNALTIAAEDQLIQPERALNLLHFLTTGQHKAPEYELILPKILCNIPLQTPVAASLDLTTTEQEEAEALLLAVIRHWDVLKNTGIDGLRGTFLLRSGKISLRNGDWRLQIESKSYDILLEQLPWGISMIKLPWMQRMLWVEWGG